jgi:hypothetical protein
MAQKVETVLIDDLDGGTAETTVRFSWSGADYEIDLSATHASDLGAVIEPYLRAGRKVSGPARRASRGSARRNNGGTPNPAEVREWAKSEGIKVNDRGRVPAELVVKFQAANA